MRTERKIEGYQERAQRRVAEELGGEVVPGPDGEQRIEHPTLAIEVESREELPQWVEEALERAEASVLPGQLPVAVLHRDGDRYADGLVVMRLHRFVRQVGE